MDEARESAGRKAVQKIGISTVCRQIYKRNTEALDLAWGREQPVIPYSFEEFEADVLADDFICSQTTVVAKWKALRASDIVTEKANRTFLDLEQFMKLCQKKVRA